MITTATIDSGNMSSLQSRRDVRRKKMKQLHAIRKALYLSSALYLSQDDLTTHGIEWSEMSLFSKGQLDVGPQFCTPFPLDKIDAAFDKAFTYKAPDGSDDDDEWHPGWLAPYDPEFPDTWCSANQVGGSLLQYLESKADGWGQLTASNKWINRG